MTEYFKKGNKITCVLTDRETGEKTVGRAKCSPEDTFDEQYGRDLAFARARLKETEKNEKFLKRAIDELQRSTRNLTAVYVAMLARALDRKDHARDTLIELEKRYTH